MFLLLKAVGPHAPAWATRPLKRLGADQTLRQQHCDRLASLIDRGAGRLERWRDLSRLLNPHTDEATGIENRLDRLPHRHLPGIPFPEISPHADQDQHRELAVFHQREHIDAIAHTAGLHEHYPARPAEMGPRQHGDPFLLSRQRHGMDFRIFERAVDQHSVPGIGHIGKLRDIPVTQDTVDLIWPHRRIGHDRGSSRLDILCLRIVSLRVLQPLCHQGAMGHTFSSRCGAAIVVKSWRKDNAMPAWPEV
jgi:hypothetical protein